MTWSLVGQKTRIWLTNNKAYNQLYENEGKKCQNRFVEFFHIKMVLRVIVLLIGGA